MGPAICVFPPKFEEVDSGTKWGFLLRKTSHSSDENVGDWCFVPSKITLPSICMLLSSFNSDFSEKTLIFFCKGKLAYQS